jgi:uncharacterized protein (TIGR02453 family)
VADFAGFSTDALAFYRDLAANPTKDFWQANKNRYDASVREPISALVATLAPRFGEAKVFRPYRDVRFAKGASPYKDHQGAFVEVASSPDGTSSGIGWYVQVNADGLMVSGGYHAHASDQVQRLRAAVDDDKTGAELVRIVDGVRSAGFEIWGRTMKTRPRGVASDHPRLELMRHQNLTGWREADTPDWMFGPEAVQHVAAQWDSLRPLVEWLGGNVGPTMSERTRRR